MGQQFAGFPVSRLFGEQDAAHQCQARETRGQLGRQELADGPQARHPLPQPQQNPAGALDELAQQIGIVGLLRMAEGIDQSAASPHPVRRPPVQFAKPLNIGLPQCRAEMLAQQRVQTIGAIRVVHRRDQRLDAVQVRQQPQAVRLVAHEVGGVGMEPFKDGQIGQHGPAFRAQSGDDLLLDVLGGDPGRSRQRLKDGARPRAAGGHRSGDLQGDRPAFGLLEQQGDVPLAECVSQKGRHLGQGEAHVVDPDHLHTPLQHKV